MCMNMFVFMKIHVHVFVLQCSFDNIIHVVLFLSSKMEIRVTKIIVYNILIEIT